MMKSVLILLVLTLSVSFLSTAAVGFNTRVGGRMDVPDVKTDAEVQKIGRFSVEEFNKKQQSDGGRGGNREVVFSEVVEAQRQVVSGIKYYLKVETTVNGLRRVFDSVVVVKPWDHNSKQLLNFSPSNNSQ